VYDARTSFIYGIDVPINVSSTRARAHASGLAEHGTKSLIRSRHCIEGLRWRLGADRGRGWQCRLAGVGAAEELLRAEGVERIVTGAGGGAEGGLCGGKLGPSRRVGEERIGGVLRAIMAGLWKEFGGVLGG